MTDRPAAALQTREEIKARVMTMVADLCADDSCPIQSVLERCVDDSITARWSAPVKVFVPLPAFREVQECIRLGYCPERPLETTA